MNATKPYDWVKSVERQLVDLGPGPASTAPEAFTWDNLSRQLSHHFEAPNLRVEAELLQWRAQDSLRNIAAPYVTFTFAVGSLEGKAYWTIAEADLNALTSSLLLASDQPIDFSDKAFQEGFTQYLSYEVAYLLAPLGFEGSIAVRPLGKEEPPPASFGMDIRVIWKGHTYFSRLLVSKELAEAWRTYSLQTARTKGVPLELAQKTDVIVHLEVGGVALTRKQWKDLSEGDFLLLDTCSIAPGVEKGRVMLTANGVPLFRGMLKKDQVKILEYPLYHEVEAPMSNGENNNDEEEDLSDIDEEVEEEESFEEDEEEIETEGDEGEEESEKSLEGEEAFDENQPEEAQSEEQPAAAAPSEPLSGLDAVPFNVVIEVGRVKMTLAKLQEMQPGQVLELNIKPEEGVDLVVHGRCIARGELLKVGETLGVRLLEIG